MFNRKCESVCALWMAALAAMLSAALCLVNNASAQVGGVLNIPTAELEFGDLTAGASAVQTMSVSKFRLRRYQGRLDLGWRRGLQHR